MSSSKTCPYCKSSDLDTDPARGDTVCMGCGSVLEENTIVSEVQVQENADGSSSVVGQFVSSEGIGLFLLYYDHTFTGSMNLIDTLCSCCTCLQFNR